jgi:hypothetical protein
MSEEENKPAIQTKAEAVRTFVAIVAATGQILILLRVYEIPPFG